MDHIVCVGVLTFKTPRLQKRKGVGEIVRTLFKANDGSFHGGEGLVFIALCSEG